MNEDMNRLEAIQSEYAQLPQFENYDLTLQLHGSVVKSTITRNTIKFERVIRPEEDLSFIGDTFDYPNTFSSRSKMFSTEGLKAVYFDKYGTLVAEHTDSVEEFRVTNRAEVEQRLHDSLKGKFYPSKPKDKPQPKKEEKVSSTDMVYKINYTRDGEYHSTLVAGSSKESIIKTAYDVIGQMGLDVTLNNVYSERIHNLTN